MGTNYYRIPTAAELEQRKDALRARIDAMRIAPRDALHGFRSIDDPQDEWCSLTPWDEFTEGTCIHLGKRSSGWRFCWNFHENRYYQDKSSLLRFIRSGQVVDEYGETWDAEEFITMALSWGNDSDDAALMGWGDREVDGLRVAAPGPFS